MGEVARWAGLKLPLPAIREEVAWAINIIVQAQRMTGGARKIVSITEVDGMEGDVVTMQEIFTCEPVGVTGAGKVYGRFVATGIRPSVLERLRISGCDIDPALFARQVLMEDDPA